MELFLQWVLFNEMEDINMSVKYDERVEKVRGDLEKISKKAESVYGDVKAACELGQEVVQDKLKDVKGDMVAAQERIRVADEENRSHLSSQMLKVQMQLRAKVEDMKTAHDKKKLEEYIDSHIIHMADLYDTIEYLLSDAELTMMEAVSAIDEYNERFGEKEEAEV